MRTSPSTTCADQTTCLANDYGGTSFAAPMWAAYIALVNQQLVANGEKTIGFLNPTIYAQNITSVYDTDFHDIASGTSGSYSATTGYDLVTGWGSPNAGLINALAPTSTVPRLRCRLRRHPFQWCRATVAAPPLQARLWTDSARLSL